MSISRSQAQALKDGFLDSLGRQPPTGDLPIIEAMLGAAAKNFIDTASANLDKANAVNTGGLQTDLRFEVETSGATYQMSVGYESTTDSAKYYDFVNKGVQGVNKPGKAPGSPYKFRFLGVSRKHAYAIEQWYRHSGKSATAIRRPASDLEGKRIMARDRTPDPNPIATLAYATAKASKREGLRATKYFDNAVKDVFGPSFIEALEVALGGEVIVSVRQAQI